MDERERPRAPGELGPPEGLGNPFAMGQDGGSVTIDYGVYREQLPLGGRTVGEIRRIAGPRYDIDPRAPAMVEAQFVDDATVVRTGQTVQFLRHSGEKGQDELPVQQLLQSPTGSLIQQVLGVKRPGRRTVAPKITIEGDVVTTTSPEGHSATLRLETLLTHLGREGPSVRDSRDLMLPDGVKWMMSRAGFTIFVHQTPPAVHNLKWIAADSKARHGPETTYRQVRIALPYLIVLAFFEPLPNGGLALGDRNECFFRNEPLRSPDDRLCYPALLNCSKFQSSAKPLSWICSPHLTRTRLPAGAGDNERVRQGLKDLMHCMLGTGFNYSSEAHEISSWFSESTGVDPRVSTIERWEEATGKDPMFATELPWLEVGHSVREVAERSLRLRAGRGSRRRTSHDVARVLYNCGKILKNKKSEDSDA